jgi:RHH-type transcriptional regulator, proline utilization regulon repressor / proline dehydrogenase / delta 1-pyrroline-5-carboxylate dehydrogenase
MPEAEQPPVPLDRTLAEEAVALARRWLDASRHVEQDAAAARLAGVLGDRNGLAFTVGFVDGVVRPEDVHVAARNLRALTPVIPRFLPLPLRAAIRIGALLAPVAPWLVVPTARLALRRMVRHLVVDASETRLGAAIDRIRGGNPNVRLNINLLGEAILGEKEAARRLDGTRVLLQRDDVDYVSIKVSATVPPHSPWAFDDAVERATRALAPLFRIAASAPGGQKFINLDMEEYRDLDLTLAVFTALLNRDEFLDLEAGIVLQAYLPDALGAMIELQRWSRARRARGGAPVKVRVVKGANLPMERVEAELHGWPLATWPTKRASDASYLAVLDYALRGEHVDAVRIGVAGHNLFDTALAWLLAQRRGVSAAVDFEMLLGMATSQAAVVRRKVGSLLLYTPVVHPREFDVAIAYLVRRLEEGASQENFMSAAVAIADDPALFAREQNRFLESVASIPAEVPPPNRTQNREKTQPPAPRDGFDNTADSDPASAANRDWARGIQARMRASALGLETAERNLISSPTVLRERIDRAVAAGAAWRALGADARAEVLHRCGDLLQSRREELLEVMGAESGKVIEQGDPEVSEVVDFAHYYAERGRELERVAGAHFTPARLTVVTPPWNFPVAIPGGSVLAGLAAGSPVIIKPAAQARRCGAVLVEALWEAGIPPDVLQYVALEERALGTELVASEQVERVVLTGGYETAELFRSFRPDLALLGETSGKNAIVVTPSADLDLAARDVAYSAFGHAGQKCSAASLVILVGSVARSERFRRQLIDAVSSYRVGYPWEPPSQVGPLIEPADGKLLRALTSLEPGQRWVVAPQQLDESGALWKPGIREAVQPGSEFHLTEYFGPVLGIMTAPGLDDAIELVNRIEYGLTSGLQSLDDGEIARWAERVQAGNLYVNRHITGAIVQRQPFGGWKRASVGNGCKTGGPNYLLAFGSWRDDPDSVGALEEVAEDPITGSTLAAARQADVSQAELAWLRTALATDVRAWDREFQARDVTGLSAEDNVLRYRPVAVTVRVEQATEVQLLRVVAAASRAQAAVIVSAARPLAEPVQRHLDRLSIPTRVENRVQWGARAAQLAAAGGRVRLLGGSSAELATAVSGSPALAIYAGEVVSAGRIELLTFLREQAISITAHRFGTPRATGSPDPLNPYAAADADNPAGAPWTGLIRLRELRRALRGRRAAGGDRR